MDKKSLLDKLFNGPELALFVIAALWIIAAGLFLYTGVSATLWTLLQ